MAEKYFYERNDYLLNSSVNKFFEEILWMTEDEFQTWVRDMRKEVVYAWDVLGIPPRVGWNEHDIIEQFNNLKAFPISEVLVVDEATGERNAIRPSTIVGNAANQFFPTMMKTKINYSKDVSEGASIYDHFADNKFLPKVYTYARRHFKRDSFYHHSNPINPANPFPVFGDEDRNPCATGLEWIKKFLARSSDGLIVDGVKGEWSFWLSEKEEDEGEYTGYDDKLRGASYLTISKDEFLSIKDSLNPKVYTNIGLKKDPQFYQIRAFRLGQKVFPIGFKAFRISWCQYAVNFPPTAAKFIYEEFTKHVPGKATVYDPSSGWGGRILGAMSASRPLHYVGTDPNTDHWIEELGCTKYEYLADFFNRNVVDNSLASLFGSAANTYEVFQLGSEVIASDPRFQKYKGNLDLIFTSPPYFAKEGYSDDPEQSCNKFPQYEAWVEGFLRPTLTTCWEYLKNDRFLLWNIASAKFGNDMLPLEEDSIRICKELGFVHVDTYKLVLARMPGSNRIDEEGGMKAKNSCVVNGLKMKMEPIFVFHKK